MAARSLHPRLHPSRHGRPSPLCGDGCRPPGRDRSHPQAPTDIDLVLLPLRTVVGLVAVNAVLPIVGRDRRRATTGAATSLVMLLGYEWVHFLIHSPHQPRTALYRARWRGHRLHHFRNERYWFGVVATVGDKGLGSAPDRDGVPVSPTARTLHPVSVA